MYKFYYFMKLNFTKYDMWHWWWQSQIKQADIYKVRQLFLNNLGPFKEEIYFNLHNYKLIVEHFTKSEPTTLFRFSKYPHNVPHWIIDPNWPFGEVPNQLQHLTSFRGPEHLKNFLENKPDAQLCFAPHIGFDRLSFTVKRDVGENIYNNIQTLGNLFKGFQDTGNSKLYDLSTVTPEIGNLLAELNIESVSPSFVLIAAIAGNAFYFPNTTNIDTYFLSNPEAYWLLNDIYIDQYYCNNTHLKSLNLTSCQEYIIKRSTYHFALNLVNEHITTDGRVNLDNIFIETHINDYFDQITKKTREEDFYLLQTYLY